VFESCSNAETDLSVDFEFAALSVAELLADLLVSLFDNTRAAKRKSSLDLASFG
jgi:hypothetical protein